MCEIVIRSDPFYGEKTSLVTYIRVASCLGLNPREGQELTNRLIILIGGEG